MPENEHGDRICRHCGNLEIRGHRTSCKGNKVAIRLRAAWYPPVTDEMLGKAIDDVEKQALFPVPEKKNARDVLRNLFAALHAELAEARHALTLARTAANEAIEQRDKAYEDLNTAIEVSHALLDDADAIIQQHKQARAKEGGRSEHP